jgi:hypothetical protein
MVAAHLWYDCDDANDVNVFECSLSVPVGGDPIHS